MLILTLPMRFFQEDDESHHINHVIRMVDKLKKRNHWPFSKLVSLGLLILWNLNKLENFKISAPELLYLSSIQSDPVVSCIYEDVAMFRHHGITHCKRIVKDGFASP